MTSQQLADELARIAGWRELGIMQTGSATGPMWYGPKSQRSRNHPFLVGSLDALEAFRREHLPDHDVFRYEDHRPGKNLVVFALVHRITRRISSAFMTASECQHPRWDAEASALIAASKENKQ